MSQEKTPVIACLKWGKGYPTVYTNVLYRAAKAFTSVPFRFVCITDHAEGLDEGIEIIGLPYFALERDLWTRGMWPKLAVFKHDFFESGTPILYMDVDVVLNGDLAPVFDHIRSNSGMHTTKDWHDTHERWFPKLFPHERITHGAVLGFTAGEQDHLYDLIKDRGPDVIDEWGDDQPFIHHQAVDQQYFPEEWILSFKKSLAWHLPVSLLKEPSQPPESCKIVSFHGRPNPQECTQKPFNRWGNGEKIGFFPVSWVKRYWNKYNA